MQCQTIQSNGFFMFGLQYISVHLFLIIVFAIFTFFNISVYVWFRYFSNPDKKREEELRHQFESDSDDSLDDIPF